ncbi:hypothetical protein HZ326_27738 [Fusarium oxysporum f. sp. albedinis]|nr:hypothetical protein HZ326_27738 [Fusarium oxysporum f. sp. albedinis]
MGRGMEQSFKPSQIQCKSSGMSARKRTPSAPSSITALPANECSDDLVRSSVSFDCRKICKPRRTYMYSVWISPASLSTVTSMNRSRSDSMPRVRSKYLHWPLLKIHSKVY